MFSIIFPPSVVRLITSLSLLATTLAAAVFLLPGIVLKLVPHYPLQRACSRYCVWVAINWVSANKFVFRLLHAVQWQIDIRTHTVRRSDERRGGTECVSTCRSRW